MGLTTDWETSEEIISDPEGMAIETTQNEIHREKRLGKKCTSVTVGQHQVF